MKSVTKRRLTADQIERLLRHGLGPEVALAGHSEFTDGAFSAVFAVSLADGRELVLKVMPEPELKLMRYEVDLAHVEIEFYRRAAAAGVPVPRLWAAETPGKWGRWKPLHHTGQRQPSLVWLLRLMTGGGSA